MPALPLEIYPVALVREIDRAAIAAHGIAGYELMRRAGAAALGHAQSRFPRAGRWQFVAGPGNNGGDAWAMARLALAARQPVDVVTLVDPARLGGDAARACGDYVAAGGGYSLWAGALDPGAGLIVDGVFGSGLAREVNGAFALTIGAMNAHPSPIVSLDVASGIHGDTGRVLGAAVRAELTVALVGLKPGYFLADGVDHTGELRFAGLDLPAACYPRERACMRQLSEGHRRRLLGRRRRNAHKGDFGHVLIVGGSPGMPGAALLAGRAALRAGAGRVSVATHASHAAALAAACPELMVRGVADAAELAPLIDSASVLALGPGLGDDDWASAIYPAAAAAGQPAVWDAGALTRLSRRATAHADRILTPHPGEAGVLLHRSAARVQEDRVAALRALTEKYRATVVLKGAATLVGAPGSRPWLCTAGNPGMASAGMGDALTGVIAALRAQGIDAESAAALGVAVHARAGDRATRGGERGLLAGDLIEAVRQEVNV